MKILILLLSIISFQAISCEAFISDIKSTSKRRVKAVLEDKGFSITDSTQNSDIQVIVKKERYFNIYGYPHFFMRKINIDVMFDGATLYDDYQSDGFPVYVAFSRIIEGLEDSSFRCVNGQVLR
jgi:hypothetical protein